MRLQEGYAAGFDGGQGHLTIPGSEYDTDVIFGSYAEAETWRLGWAIRDQLVVRRVRRYFHPGVTGNGEAYEIIE